MGSDCCQLCWFSHITAGNFGSSHATEDPISRERRDSPNGDLAGSSVKRLWMLAAALGLASLALWLLSCLAVGIAATALGNALHRPHPALLGTLTGVVYSLFALHFLPLHWVSAANSPFSGPWTGLAFAAFIGVAYGPYFLLTRTFSMARLPLQPSGTRGC